MSSSHEPLAPLWVARLCRCANSYSWARTLWWIKLSFLYSQGSTLEALFGLHNSEAVASLQNNIPLPTNIRQALQQKGRRLLPLVLIEAGQNLAAQPLSKGGCIMTVQRSTLPIHHNSLRLFAHYSQGSLAESPSKRADNNRRTPNTSCGMRYILPGSSCSPNPSQSQQRGSERSDLATTVTSQNPPIPDKGLLRRGFRTTNEDLLQPSTPQPCTAAPRNPAGDYPPAAGTGSTSVASCH